jgi:hypothetical protein
MEICGIKIQPHFTTNEFDNYTEVLQEQYNIIGFIDGHFSKGKIRNPIWVIIENNLPFLLIFCIGNDIFTKLCPKSYKKILDFEKNKNNNNKITWHSKEYIYGNVNEIGVLTMHQVIMNYYHNGRGTGGLSIDHIDRDSYNNILSNLRIATCEEQNQNRKGTLPGTKRERQYNARELPEGISQEDMPKYITYNVNIWDKQKNKKRDFFRIEGHPLLMKKVWEGTKSMEVSIDDKLEKVKKVLNDLDNGILPIRIERTLPKHVYYTNINEKSYLVYDNRNNGHTKKMKIKDLEFDINNSEKREKQVYIFNHWIIETFGESDTILPENYNYCGEPINNSDINESLIKLPKYISIINERGTTILSYQRVVNKERWSKKLKLSKYYESFEEPSEELLKDIEETLTLLNKEIIKKYGKENSVLKLTEEETEKIIETINQEKAIGFPLYTRIQTFQNGDYLVFNKIVDKQRFNTTIKLPDNFNKNEQLHKLNKKIIELYGKKMKLDLIDYPFQQKNEPIEIPENMYVVLNCKSPYLFININSNDTIIHKLPLEYDLQNEINRFHQNQTQYTPIIKQSYDTYLNSYSEWKPNRISLTIKNKKFTILYKYKTPDFLHYYSMIIPSNEFNIYIHLITINEKIINKYGNEFSIFSY